MEIRCRRFEVRENDSWSYVHVTDEGSTQPGLMERLRPRTGRHEAVLAFLNTLKPTDVVSVVEEVPGEDHGCTSVYYRHQPKEPDAVMQYIKDHFPEDYNNHQVREVLLLELLDRLRRWEN